MQISGNLLSDLPPLSKKETFETLFQSQAARIERIVSHSSSSPDGFWYDQNDDEWVLIIKGSATLRFESDEVKVMKEGDHLLIPRHCRHRVDHTSEETIWLAVHVSIPAHENRTAAT
jgi:cupin 2 domain-containing protein